MNSVGLRCQELHVRCALQVCVALMLSQAILSNQVVWVWNFQPRNVKGAHVSPDHTACLMVFASFWGVNSYNVANFKLPTV